MSNLLTPEQLQELGAIDSPTISNAIEKFNVRNRTEGYASYEMRSLFPDLPPFIGYAVTCTVDSTVPSSNRNNKLVDLFRVVEAAPKPVVVVMKDMGTDRLRSCHAGDNLAAVFHRLGGVALLTDGGVRDAAAIRERAPGFHVFAPGLVVSHGTSIVLELNMTVSVCGLTVQPGDLLHGDANGVVSIPHAIAGQVAEQAKQILEFERKLIDYINTAGDDFNIDDLAKRMGH